MARTTHRGRRAAVLENDELRVTVIEEGGHLAEIFDRRTGVNPLWTPPWPSVEPSTYDPRRHPEYGEGEVVRIEPRGHSAYIRIHFPDFGERAFALEHVTLYTNDE